MAEENSDVEKQFGFSEVSWTIKNCCVAPPNSHVSFYSPEFHIRGPHVTKWRMILRRDFIPKTSYAVSFCLQRLKCSSFYGLARVDCVLMYSDHHGQFIEIDFKHDFGTNLMSVFEQYLMQAGVAPVNRNHFADFQVKCKILVYFLDISKEMPLCEDLGVRRLSEDVFFVYEEGIKPDLHIHFGNRDPMKAHRAILLNRLTDEELKDKIKSAPLVEKFYKIELNDFLYEPSEKVIRFLYSGNLKYVASQKDLPSVSAYRFAKFLNVEPVISCYDPDAISLTTETEVEEYFATWTIENFCSRNETILRSPQMVNKTLDTDWHLKIYPNGIGKKGNYVYVRLDIHARIQRIICVELFLKDDPENVYRSYHKTVLHPQAFIERNFIALDDVRNNYSRDDSLTIGLRLRISTGKDSNFIVESIANHKIIYEQKYYERLSEDITSLYNNQTYHDMCIDFQDQNIKICAHEYMLHMRCPDLSYALINNDLNFFLGINPAVVHELFYFLYSGKLRKNMSLDDMFCLYRTAVKYNFFILQRTIAKELSDSLSEFNARAILSFADSQNIENLRDSAENFIKDLNV